MRSKWDIALWAAFWFCLVFAIVGYSMYPLSLILGW